LRFVAATDFSSDAGNAVRRAALLASQHGAELELLHVVSRRSLESVREWVRTPADVAERLVEDTRSVLEQASASLGTPAAARVAVGDVLEEIVASGSGAALLVVGARGLNPLRDAIVGTTAEHLLPRCRCPVLVVRTPAREPYRNVLAAIDLLPGSESGLACAARIAPAAKLTAVHAYEVVFEGALRRAGVQTEQIEQHRAQVFQQALAETRRLSEAATGDADRFLPMVERGDAAALILERERSLGADLVVISQRTRSSVEALVLGSVTRHVLSDAKADVLVVHQA
jgi:nucleotide-binding universal stress UspA family protein